MEMNEKLMKSLGLLDKGASKADTTNSKIAEELEATIEEEQWEEVADEGMPQEANQLSEVLNSLSASTTDMSDADEYTPEPLPQVDLKPNMETAVREFEDTDITEDYNRVRSLTYGVQDASLAMLSRAMKIAGDTENPRAFAVFNDLVTNIRGLNKDLMETHKAFKNVTIDAKAKPKEGEEEDEKNKETSPGHRTSNTAELLRQIEEAEKAVKDDLEKAPPPEMCKEE